PSGLKAMLRIAHGSRSSTTGARPLVNGQIAVPRSDTLATDSPSGENAAARTTSPLSPTLPTFRAVPASHSLTPPSPQPQEARVFPSGLKATPQTACESPANTPRGITESASG